MSNDCAKNCWEFWNCEIETRKECPAYKNKLGKECWFVAGSFADLPNCPRAKNNYKGCWECSWFQKLTFNNE